MNRKKKKGKQIWIYELKLEEQRLFTLTSTKGTQPRSKKDSAYKQKDKA